METPYPRNAIEILNVSYYTTTEVTYEYDGIEIFIYYFQNFSKCYFFFYSHTHTRCL